MAQIVVRNIDEDIMQGLKSLAGRAGVSTEQAVRSLIEDAVTAARDLEAFRDAAATARAHLHEERGQFRDSAAMIREDRDR